MILRSFVSAGVLLALCLTVAPDGLRAGEPPAKPPLPPVSFPASDAPLEKLDELDEVTVKGTRLYELRAAMVAAEDRFYARYNELNKKDEFDIECHQEKRTGTTMTVRRCYPRAVSMAARAEGLAFVEALQSGDSAARPRSSPATVVLASQVEDYQNNMLALLKRHPELRRLVREREKIEEQYDRLRKAR